MSLTDRMNGLDARIGTYSRWRIVILRSGLGLVILLAGVHKLVAPAEWHAYLTTPLVTWWPASLLPLDPTFVLFGLGEVLFGVLLIVDWHTPTVAALTGVSLAGVVVNLFIGLVVGDPFAAVLIRDLGLTVFAFGVALDADGTTEPSHAQDRSSRPS